MPDDLKPLMVSVEANLNKLTKQMAAAAKMGSDAANSIDKSFKTANDNVAKSFDKSSKAATISIGQQRNAVQNLGFQLNDLATGLASGTSPFTLMAQQGSQVVQALEEGGGGIKNIMSTLAGAAGQLINPLSIATFLVIGLGAAAVEMFAKLFGGAQLSEKEQHELVESIYAIGEAYKSINPALAAYGEALKANQDATKASADLQKAQAQEVGKGVDAFEQVQSTFKNLQLRQPFISRDSFAGLSDAAQQLDSLLTQFREGKLSAKDMAEAITQIQQAVDAIDTKDPATASLKKQFDDAANSFKNAQGNAETLAGAIKDVASAPDKTKLEAFDKAIKELQGIGVEAFDAQTKAANAYADALKNAQNAIQALDAQTEFLAANGRAVAEQWEKAGAALAGASSGGDFAKTVRQIESGGRDSAHAPVGTASGRYQFTDGTFLTVIRQLQIFPKETSDAIILAQKNNVELQEKAFEKLTADNAEALAKAGVAATDVNKYILHFLGEQGGLNLLRANPNTPVSQAVGGAAVSANPALLGGGRTAQQAIDAITKFYQAGERAASGANKGFEDSIQNLKDETEQLNAAAKATGAYGAAIDEETYKKVKAVEIEKLTQAARKDGIELTDEQRKTIDDVADAYARAEASTKGYANQTAAAKKAAQEQVEAQKRLNQQLNAAASQFAGMATGFVTGFISDLKQGKSATEALTDALGNLADQLLSMALNSLFKSLFQSMLGSSGGNNPLAALAGSMGFHSGGVVGQGGTPRRVSPLVFAGAPRLHNGLAADEMPAILQRGETVLPRGFRAGGSTSVSNSIGNINIDMSGTGVVASDSDSGRRLGLNIQKLIQREIVSQSRPGGLLTAGGSGARVGR